jgi:hypothetical protein
MPIGPLANYGYEGEVLLSPRFARLRTRAERRNSPRARNGSSAIPDHCIPEQADLSLALPVGQGKANTKLDAIRLPRPTPAQWKLSARRDGNRVLLDVSGADEQALYFFAYEEGKVQHAAPQPIERTAAGIRIAVPVSTQPVENSPAPAAYSPPDPARVRSGRARAIDRRLHAPTDSNDLVRRPRRSMPRRSARRRPNSRSRSVAGGTVKLSQYRGKHVVLEWVNPDCPYVRKHYGSANMQKLQKEYTGKNVAWLTINSTRAGSSGIQAARGNGVVDEEDGLPRRRRRCSIRRATQAARTARAPRRTCTSSTRRACSCTRAASTTSARPTSRT